jgi:hypothetical protein
MKRKIKVTINRSKWRTGLNSTNQTGEGNTALLNKEGYMCCLGFCMAASKVAKKNLLDTSVPGGCLNQYFIDPNKAMRSSGVRALTTKSPTSPNFKNSELAFDAMKINDSVKSTPETKEKQLLELFNDSVFELEFTGEYTKEKNE